MPIREFNKIGRYLVIVILIGSLTSCSEMVSVDVLQPLSEEEEIYTFYGEGKSRSYLDNKLIQDIDFKEWKGIGKLYHSEADTRMDQDFYEQYYGEIPPEELIEGSMVKLKEEDTYNEKQMIVYLVHKNEYSIKDISLADEVSPSVLLGINAALNAGGLKDYATSVINELADEYHLTIEDNVKINGRLTQHITGVSKKEKVDEVQEIWIDQNTWLIVKERSQSGKYVEEFEYLKFQFNPKIDKNLFKVEIPDDAFVNYMDDDLATINEEITIDEAAKRLGSPILYLEEKQGICLKSIRYIESLDDNYGRVELTYYTADGREVIVQCSPFSSVYEKMDLGYEKIVVQGKSAIYREVGTMKMIGFIKEGTICNIYIKNSEMNRVELIELANALLVKE